jgi:ATP-binding cassette subfamily F protein 3
MISGIDISVQFGGRYLFRDCSFHIGPHDRIGVVGSNGTGKSTLLKILDGAVEPESGRIDKARYVTVGYLPQEGMHSTGRTLFEEAQSVFARVLELQERLASVQKSLETADPAGSEAAELVAIMGDLQHQLEESDAFRISAKVEKILMGLGFTERDFTRRTDEFSGGWQMRIALAKLLLLQPSLLLLDEPTNHLDLESLAWLEGFLASYEGAVMLVSHDKRFLNTLTRRTFELSLGVFAEYTGNYDAYLEARAERRELQLKAFKNQQQRIRQTERFIERFRYKATKARQVQSRIKQLEKMELIELDDDEDLVHFAFPPAPSSGRTVMELRGITKAYGALKVYTGIDLDLERGDRIALVGINGAGKSTLARIIAGVEPFDAGTRVVGQNVSIAYFAQHQAEELDPERTVLETLDESAVGEIRKYLRTILGCFLFRGDDVFKKVGVLSGGEKSRLALAKMLVRPSNLLVLDEPTNHLDMQSKNILQIALEEYEGTCVIVSHDRDFLDPLVDKVIACAPGRLKLHLGTVSEYLAREEGERSPAAATRRPDADRKRREAEARQAVSRATKQMREAIARLEQLIGEREMEKQELENQLGDPAFYASGSAVAQAGARRKALLAELEESYEKWHRLHQELEAATARTLKGLAST